MNHEFFLLLGTNLGDKLKNISAARQFIEAEAGSIINASSIYKTGAWGKTDQPEFYNQVILIRSSLSPRELLRSLLCIEQRMGRVRNEPWGPRIIDLDILFNNDTVVNEPDLIIPHPGVPARRFTLVPLQEIAPTFRHPVLRCTITDLLKACDDESTVEKIS